MKKGYYQADCQNGVTFYGELMEDPDAEILSARDFKDSLDTLNEDEIIYTFFDNDVVEIFTQIEKEYGIH